MKPTSAPSLRPDHSRYLASLEESRKKIEAKKIKARKELEELSARLKFNPAKKIPNLKSASLELQRIYEDLDRVSNINSDIQDLPELFQRLANAEHEMLLAAKYEQFSRLQSAEYDYSKIEEAISEGRLFDVPNYTISLQDNLKTLDEIPSLTAFENRNEELKKLLDLLSQSIDISSEDFELNQLQYRKVAAKIFASFAKNSEPFFAFLANRDKPEAERNLSYVDAKWNDNSDEILDKIRTMVEESIAKKTAEKHRLQISKFENESELFSSTIEKLKLENEASEITHEIKILYTKRPKFKEEIDSISKKIAEIKNPQDPIERLMRSVGKIFRNFVKTLPADGFLSKFFSSLATPKSKSQEELEAWQKKLEGKRKERSELEDQIFIKLQQTEKLGKEIEKHKKLLSATKKSGKKDAGIEEDRDQRIAELDAKNKKSAEKLEKLNRHKATPKATSRTDLTTKDEIVEGLALAHQIESDGVIQAHAAHIKAKESASQSKKKAFENRIKRQFHSIFEIAKRVQAGDVKMIPDAIDMSLSGLKVIVDQISVPIIQQALAATLALAKFAHERNRKSSSDRVSEVGKDEASSDLIDEIADAFTKSYSAMVDGMSPLDRLSDKGVEKFADNLVLQLIGAIGAKSPPWTETASAEQTAENRSGREEATDAIVSAVAKEENFSAEESKDGEEVLTNQTRKLAQAMVGWALQGKEDERTPKQLTEFFSKVRFEDEDLEDAKKAPNWNAVGLAKRAGIIDSEGNFYSPIGRSEGREGKDSKYGWRLATEKEEESLRTTGKISGYQNFIPSSKIFEEKFAALLGAVEGKDFKDPIQIERKETLLKDLVEDYVKEKLQGKSSADLHKFLKTEADKFLKIGTSGRGLHGITRDEDRVRFGAIEKLIIEAADVKFKAEQDRVNRRAAIMKTARGIVAKASMLVAAAGAAITSAEEVDASQVREAVASIGDTASHADELAAAAAKTVVDAARSAATGAAALAGAASELSQEDIENLGIAQSLATVKEIAKQSGLMDKATQYQAAVTDVVKTALAELTKTKKHLRSEKQLTPVLFIGCLVKDLLDEAAKENIEKFCEATKHKDYKGYEDIFRDGASPCYIRIKRHEGKIIDVRLFQKSSIRSDKEISLFESEDSNEINKDAEKKLATILRGYKEKIEETKEAKLTAEVETAYVAAQKVEREKERARAIAPSGALTCGFSVGSVRPHVTDHREPQFTAKTRQELESKLEEILASFSDTKNMEGMRRDGRRITMPNQEKSPFFLSFDLSEEGKITDVKLHSASKPSDTALPLYDAGTSKIKDARVGDIATLLHFYSRLANATPSHEEVKSARSEQMGTHQKAAPRLLTS